MPVNFDHFNAAYPGMPTPAEIEANCQATVRAINKLWGMTAIYVNGAVHITQTDMDRIPRSYESTKAIPHQVAGMPLVLIDNYPCTHPDDDSIEIDDTKICAICNTTTHYRLTPTVWLPIDHTRARGRESQA